MRLLYLGCALVIAASGVWALFLPGFRQYAAEGRKALRLLRSAPLAPGLGVGRAATQEDFEALAAAVPEMADLNPRERDTLIHNGRAIQAAEGTAILRAGQADDRVYFIVVGKTLVGRANPEGGYQSLATLLENSAISQLFVAKLSERMAATCPNELPRFNWVDQQALKELRSTK